MSQGLIEQAARKNIVEKHELKPRELFRFRKVSPFFLYGKLLDVGSRTADLKKFLPHNVEYVGLDIAEEYEKNCEHFILCNISKDKVPVEDNYFNTVHIGEVLEHVSNFFYVFEEIHRVLKPGGRIIITVPNNQDVLQAISVICFRRYQRRRLDLKLVEKSDTHLHSFCEGDLLKICQMIGFRPIFCDRFYNQLKGRKLPEINLLKPFATFLLYVAEKY